MTKLNTAIWFSILMLLIALVTENFKPLSQKRSDDVNRIEKAIIGQEHILEDIFYDHVTSDSLPYKGLNQEFLRFLNKKGVHFFVYHNEKLQFWSTNSVDMPSEFQSWQKDLRFKKFGNSWYVLKYLTKDDKKFIGTILVKNEFLYENRFLKNTFNKSFKICDNAQISSEPRKNYHLISDYDHEPLFYISFEDCSIRNGWYYYLTTAFYFLFFISLLNLTSILARKPVKVSNRSLLFISLVIFLFVLKACSAYFKFPYAIYQTELFAPYHYASSSLVPSIGDLVLYALLLVYFAFEFNQLFFNQYFYTRKPFVKKITGNLLIFFIGILFLFTNIFFNSLILNSSIFYDVSNLQNFDQYTFLGYLSLLLVLMAFSLFSIKIVRTLKRIFTLKYVLIVSFLLYSLIGIISTHICETSKLIEFIFLAVFISILTYQVYRKGIFRSYSQIFVLILIFAIYTTYKIDLITGNKEKNNLKVLAIKLSTEHDPVAEMLIENIDQKIKNDDLIKEYLFTDPLQFEELYSYLRKNYFTGYWNKYDFQLTACNPKDSLYVGVPENNWYHCHNFFNNLLLQYGVDIPESNFYYLDNFNGRISYFGEFPIYKGDQTYTLFLELDSRLVQVEMGYPELLIDEETSDNTINNKFAYAKYHEKKLISQSGEFHYSLNISTYDIKDKKTTFRNFEGYNHLIYKLDKENTIIISTPSKTFFNHLLSFTYIFGFYFVLISLLYSLINIKKLKNQFHLSLRNRIQFAVTSILIISLLLVATGTILLSKRQFKEKHNEILREKIQSVYIELDHKLAFEDTLTSEWQTEKYDNLNQLLIKFSDVFYSDINLYNTDGQLIATSRPEIFDQFLLTDRIDFEAYEQLHLNKKAEFIHEERIGGLNYLSAYVPFLNAENELLAYLNLPYFTRQDNLRSEITNLVVAVINVYAILILITLSLAYLISNQITKPVSLLQNRLAQIQLGKRNQYLSYKNKDEIGQLVEVYNQMVDELEQSAQLLAKTERESAWREMAKQIAHEIKNPLTPMKLNVQHFKRSFDPERPDWKEKLEKFSDNLVNHINNLSAIATEFSNFAKMPQAKNEKIDLVKVIQDAYSLFKSQKHIKLEIKSELEKAYIIADKEQMLRVFINLIKNAFQAIPEEKEGIITIDIRKTKGWVKIAVKDNGTGIPNDIRDKLFQPSFTTKSSGMGLGLAIVKNIVQYSGGTIDYDTHESEGTEFFIHLPLAN